MSAQPIRSPRDAAARDAFAALCRRLDGYAPVAERYAIDPRTARRMFRRERTVPPNLAAQIAADLEPGPLAAALCDWAAECADLREQESRHAQA